MVGSLVVMGVSGCGKSHLGAAVAGRLDLPLVEGDDFHSEANRALMRSGIPLTDAHRAEWLAQLGMQLMQRPGGVVLTCSALKVAYRDQLRAAAPGLRFAWLDLDATAAQARVTRRSAHFFPAGLVETQFAALEPPLHEPGVLRLDALWPLHELTERVVQWMVAGGRESAAGMVEPAPT